MTITDIYQTTQFDPAPLRSSFKQPSTEGNSTSITSNQSKQQTTVRTSFKQSYVDDDNAKNSRLVTISSPKTDNISNSINNSTSSSFVSTSSLGTIKPISLPSHIQLNIFECPETDQYHYSILLRMYSSVQQHNILQIFLTQDHYLQSKILIDT